MALVLHAKAPGSVLFEADEVEDINLYQLCLILHAPPSVVEDISIKHFEGLLATRAANGEIEADRMKQARKKRGKRN